MAIAHEKSDKAIEFCQLPVIVFCGVFFSATKFIFRKWPKNYAQEFKKERKNDNNNNDLRTPNTLSS